MFQRNQDSSDLKRVRVVVLGAGYAGMLAAIRLAGKSRRADVTLIGESDFFVERVRLHQYAANQQVPKRRIANTLRGTRVSFLRGTVEGLDLENHHVRVVDAITEQTQDVAYDYLMYAAGSLTSLDGVDGVREHAYSLKPFGARSVDDLRTLLPALNESHGRLVVVGGGPTGVEAAAEFAESYPDLQVTLTTRGEVLPLFPGKPREHVVRRLARLGVDIRTRTPVTQIGPASLSLDGESDMPFDACLWCGGFSAPPLARKAGLMVNARGQVLVDPTLRSVSHPNVFALGDAAYPAYEAAVEIRMAAFTATAMGAHAADNLASLVNGKPLRPFGFAYVGLGIALGRHDAVGFNTYPYGSPRSPMFTGWLAVQVREFFVNFLATLPTYERLMPGFFFWLGKGRVQDSRPLAIAAPRLPVDQVS
jgi:NADH dehydrogenase